MSLSNQEFRMGEMQTPKPLRSLTQEWHECARLARRDKEHEIAQVYSACESQLQGILNRWEGELDKIDAQQSGSLNIQSIKLRILGASPKGIAR